MTAAQPTDHVEAVRAEALELVSYDPSTGEFTRRSTGKPAGFLNRCGYLVISIRFKRYTAHRLAWLITYGDWPSSHIDHINEDKRDNRITNLREATPSENHQNRSSPNKNNKSGYLGVYLHRPTGKWAASISVCRKTKYLGLFETAELASEAYLSAKRSMHPFSNASREGANGQ
jgi:hypothetical protein